MSRSCEKVDREGGQMASKIPCILYIDEIVIRGDVRLDEGEKRSYRELWRIVQLEGKPQKRRSTDR